MIMWGSAPFLISQTMRVSVVDSSRTSRSAGSFRLMMTSAIFSIAEPRFTS